MKIIAEPASDYLPHPIVFALLAIDELEGVGHDTQIRTQQDVEKEYEILKTTTADALCIKNPIQVTTARG